jgi:hypothetical protein
MGDKNPKTLAEYICYLPDPKSREELEEFRISFEERTGALTDLTRNYTCMLPEDVQAWLIRNHPRHFYKGLPDFVKAYVGMKMKIAIGNGGMDIMPDTLIDLFVREKMS